MADTGVHSGSCAGRRPPRPGLYKDDRQLEVPEVRYGDALSSETNTSHNRLVGTNMSHNQLVGTTRLTTGLWTDISRNTVTRALHCACALSFRRHTKHCARHVGIIFGPPPTASMSVATAWSTRHLACFDTCTVRTSAFVWEIRMLITFTKCGRKVA